MGRAAEQEGGCVCTVQTVVAVVWRSRLGEDMAEATSHGGPCILTASLELTSRL